jgi:hypothetical protein
VLDLRRDHIKVAHRDPSNNPLKENPLETVSNPMDENSSKNSSENAEKEKCTGLKDLAQD